MLVPLSEAVIFPLPVTGMVPGRSGGGNVEVPVCRPKP